MSSKYWSNFIKTVKNSKNIKLVKIPDNKMKTAKINVTCNKRNHEIERSIKDIYSNLLKNSNNFYCNISAKIDGEIKTLRNSDKDSDYHRVEIVAEDEYIIEDGIKWKKLLDIYNNYKVSEYGDVRNIKTNKILKAENVGGYNRVTLSTGSRVSKRKIFLHQLVVMCFLEYDENIYSIDHIDKNPLNNHYSNLRQCSMKVNNNNRKVASKTLTIEESDIECEIWKETKTSDKTVILVSNYGRLKTNNLITKGQIISKGYCSYNGNLVHRLVAKAFLPEPSNNNMVVNHKNGIKTDNNLTNLEWITQSENTIHGFNLEDSKKLKAVAQILDGKIIAKYPSIEMASQLTNIKRASIEYSLTHYTTGKEIHIKAGGFEWVYIDDEKIKNVWKNETLDTNIFEKTASKFSPKPVILKDTDGNILKEFKNMTAASKECNVTVNNIKKSANNNIVIEDKYIFEFK